VLIWLILKSTGSVAGPDAKWFPPFDAFGRKILAASVGAGYVIESPPNTKFDTKEPTWSGADRAGI
jgi:hypothetical protein